MILEGSIVLEGEGVPSTRYGAGDVIFFRNGAHARWHVEGYVKKVAFLRQTYPVGLSLAVRAVNKLKRMFSKGRTQSLMPDNALTGQRHLA
jgi:hypothetical protein